MSEYDDRMNESVCRCIICKEAISTSNRNCPISVTCKDCWRKRQEKQKKGIADIQCPKCEEWFEIKEPLPETHTCEFCGTVWNLDYS